MYNYHKHIKKGEEEVKKEKLQRIEEMQKESRKRDVSELAHKYEKRIQTFLFEMIESPLQINNYQSPLIDRTNRQLYRVEKNKQMNLSSSKTGFNFKNFKTDKERIDEILNSKKKDIRLASVNNKAVSDTSDCDDPHNHLHPQNRVQIKIPAYMQPSMRFKPRTELERVFETVNKYNFGRVSQSIIDEQVKSSEKLTKFRRLGPKEENMTYSHVGDRFKINTRMSNLLQLEEGRRVKTNKNSENEDDEIETITRNKRESRSFVDKSIAKKVMKELHYKTHFKAASVYCLNMNATHNDSTNLLKRTQSEMGNIYQKAKVPSINYDLDYNPIFDNPHKETENPNTNDLKYLRDLSRTNILQKPINRNSIRNDDYNFIFSLKSKTNSNPESILKSNPVTFFEQFKQTHNNPHCVPNEEEDQNIQYGKDTFLKSRIDLISKKVLKSCNYISQKNENNNSNLKSGSGKLMITNGLSINDFAEKYNLPK